MDAEEIKHNSSDYINNLSKNFKVRDEVGSILCLSVIVN